MNILTFHKPKCNISAESKEAGMNNKFIISKITCGFWFLFAAFNLIVRVLLLGQFANIVTVAFSLIVALIILACIKKQRRKPIVTMNCVGATFVFIAYFNFAGTAIFNSISLKAPFSTFCYSNDIKYIHSGKDTEFPDKLPADVSNCTIDFVPPVLQGSGFVEVSFNTSEKVCDEYITRYSEMAILPALTVAELNGQKESEILTNINDYVDTEEPITVSDLCIDIPHDVSQEYPDAEVYVVRSNFNWNHPHSFTFICDRESGFVMMRELG